MLEWAASWAGVSVLDNEVHIFHHAAICKLHILLTDAGLRRWYFAKCMAEAEAALRFGTLLQLVGKEAQFLNPPWLDSVDEEDEWNGFETVHHCQSTAGGTFDNMAKEDGNWEGINTAQCNNASDDEGAVPGSGASDNDSDEIVGDPINDEEFSVKAIERRANEAMAAFTSCWCTF
jgi:hypothetical protein